MKKLRFVLINDLKAYIEDRAFLKVDLFYLGILSLVVLIGWPGDALLSFDQPQFFLALAYAQIIILTYLGGMLTIRSSPGAELDLEDWLRYTPLTPTEIALGKIGGLFACIILTFSSSLPLIILSYLMGGISSRSALAIYSLLPFPIIAFINFGLFLRLTMSLKFSFFTLNAITFIILNVMTLIFVLGLYLTRTAQRELFYLNPRFLFLVFILSIPAFFVFLKILKKMRQRQIFYEKRGNL